MNIKMNETHLQLAIDAWRRIMPLNHPADVSLKYFFKDHPQMGKKDRSFVAELVFGLLRRKRLIEYVLQQSGSRGTPREMVLVYLSRIEGMNLGQLRPFLSESEAKWIGEIRAVDTGAMPLAVQAEFPDWLCDKLATHMSPEQILQLGRSLQEAATFDLRVNSYLSNREEVLEQLQGSGVEPLPTPYSPVGVRFQGHFALHEHPLFTSGKVEVQDEGSQLMCYLLAPKRRDMVVDFCAGAGGKTLLLGALMHSGGRIYAYDVSEKRLANLKPRLKRSGLSNITPQLIANENDLKIKRLAGKIDKVLVDAPCSGLGTLRRNPDLKFRQSPESLAELTVKQTNILNAAARLLKSGGRLVYATCSFLPEENQNIVDAFLATHPEFEIEDASSILKAQGIDVDTGKYLQLLPGIHGTDGFFAAALRRV